MFVGPKARTFLAMLPPVDQSTQELPLTLRDTHGAQTDLERLVMADLWENGLLTLSRSDAAFGTQPVALPERDLVHTCDIESVQFTARDVVRFVSSCIVATYRLKVCTIEATVARLQRRKHLRAAQHTSATRVRRLVSLYRRLRPLYPRDFLCLFDSLSLIEFLAKYRCYPNMIFAVRLDPWYAHCWVQYEDLALNQDSDDAHTYLPLMSV